MGKHIMNPNKRNFRMNKNIFFIFVFIIFTGFAYCQENIIIIDNTIFGNPKKTAVVFMHDEHNKLANIENCFECHHIYENGKLLKDKSSEDKQCSYCHKVEKQKGKISLINAFHKNCKGCHKKEKKVLLSVTNVTLNVIAVH